MRRYPHRLFHFAPEIIARTIRRMVLTLIMLVITIGLPGNRAKEHPQASVGLPAQTSNANSKSQVQMPLPPCPRAGLGSPQPSPNTGHHRVTLSWNAGAGTPQSDDSRIGYCLYRSQKKNVPPQPNCQQCQQINPRPVSGTSCVDDLVEDKATYYYTVIAINAQGRPSSPSNQTSARIVGDKNTTPGQGGPAQVPVCRIASGAEGSNAR
jgi:hypothetical protein